MNAFEIAALVIVCLGFVAAVTALIMRKLKHKGGCDCSCSDCSHCPHCSGKTDNK